MKIVAVQTGLEPDSVLGGNITDRGFLTGLADRGVEVHVFAEKHFPIFEHPGFVHHTWRRFLPRQLPYTSNLGVAVDLRSLLHRIGPVDWIRFNSPYVVGLGTALAADGHRIWGSYLHCEDWPMWKVIDSWLPGRCDLVTCLSEDTRRTVVERCPESDHDRNVVVPVGIDIARMDRIGRSREAIRAELGISPEEVLVLFVGVLIPRKGIRDLVATWKAIDAETRSRARLVLIAKPVAEEETALVSDLASSDPRVQHLPKVPYENIPDYFRAADVFFFPTHREGFGIVVGEAMAARLPVLTTRAEGVRCVVSEGESALLADVGDVAQLAAGLRMLVADASLRRRLGEEGRKRVESRFAWGPILDGLYGRLATPAGPEKRR